MYMIVYWDLNESLWCVYSWTNRKREAEKLFRLAQRHHETVQLLKTVEQGDDDADDV